MDRTTLLYADDLAVEEKPSSVAPVRSFGRRAPKWNAPSAWAGRLAQPDIGCWFMVQQVVKIGFRQIGLLASGTLPLIKCCAAAFGASRHAERKSEGSARRVRTRAAQGLAPAGTALPAPRPARSKRRTGRLAQRPLLIARQSLFRFDKIEAGLWILVLTRFLDATGLHFAGKRANPAHSDLSMFQKIGAAGPSGTT